MYATELQLQPQLPVVPETTPPFKHKNVSDPSTDVSVHAMEISQWAPVYATELQSHVQLLLVPAGEPACWQAIVSEPLAEVEVHAIALSQRVPSNGTAEQLQVWLLTPSVQLLSFRQSPFPPFGAQSLVLVAQSLPE